MLDGGGTGQLAGTTNWVSHNVRQMWSLVENQQTDTHWQHVSGWRKTSELSLLHLSRLKQYRENLVEAWPPEKNEASKAYVARLDYLIETVQGVYDTAAANQQTLTGVTQAIWESRRNLEEIHRQYLAKEQAKQQYDAAVTANNGRPPAGQQATTQADLEDLNWRARHIMYGLSSELATAQVQLRKPPVYKDSRRVGEPSQDGGSGAMGSSSPPVLPPVVPMPTSGGASYTPSPTPAVHTVVPTTPSPGAGPILGGTGPIAPPAVPPTPPSVVPPTPPAAHPGAPPPISPGLLPGTKPPGLAPGGKPPGLPPGYSTTSKMPPSAGLNKSGFGPNGGLPPRVMPPGGMIGSSPGTGLSQPASGTGTARRINPIGGVIGSGGGGANSSGSIGQRPTFGTTRAVGTNQAYGMGSARSSSQSNEEEGRHWDPDNPWEIDEGVAPVVLPSRENRRIDPGPTIGSSR